MFLQNLNLVYFFIAQIMDGRFVSYSRLFFSQVSYDRMILSVCVVLYFLVLFCVSFLDSVIFFDLKSF